MLEEILAKVIGIQENEIVATKVTKILDDLRACFQSDFINQIVDAEFDNSRLKQATEKLSDYELQI